MISPLLLRRWSFLAVVVTLPLAAQSTSPYQVHRDVIRGRISDDSGKGIAGAAIVVTMAPERVTSSTESDANGLYELLFANGTGDYLVHMSAVGRQTLRVRITRSSNDSIFILNATLKTAVTSLQAVSITAVRTRIARENLSSILGTPGSNEELAGSGVTAAVPPDQRSDINALANSAADVTTGKNGAVSVFGLAPSQNAVTLNGLAFSAASVPRSARTQTVIALSTYDPSRGGFSGAQTRVVLPPGDLNSTRRAFLTFDSPFFQSSDPIATSTGQNFTAVDLNMGAAGLTNLDRWVYNAGVEIKRRFSRATSISGANDETLLHAGIAPDSARRMLSALDRLGLPLESRGNTPSNLTDAINIIARVDRPLFDYKTFRPVNSTWGLTAFLNFDRRAGFRVSPTATDSRGGEAHNIAAGLQGTYSVYLGRDGHVLNDTHSGLSVHLNSTSPSVDLPDGEVLVASAVGSRDREIAQIGFGGNAALNASRVVGTWETTNSTYFYWAGAAGHRGEAYVNGRIDRYFVHDEPNRFGTYSYNSFADLIDNRPASFTRMLSSPSATGGEWSGAFALSDHWTASPRLSLMYGARLEANAFDSAPAYDPEIERVFGATTSNSPSSVHVSPRLGFSWISSGSRVYENLIENSMGAFVPETRGVLRGGIGEFRNLPEPTLLADAIRQMRGSRRISCFGPATPVADWRSFVADETTIPTNCASGTPTQFADVAPQVSFFEKSYKPARSWRGELSWTSSLKALAYSIGGNYAVNLNQPSTSDLNFSHSVQFTLPNEGARPVFVPTSSIVASTGAVASSAVHVSPRYGSVLTQLSDLRGSARQVSAHVRPFALSRWLLDMTYVYTDVQNQSRGFDGATFDDPSNVSWARGDFAPRQQIGVSAGRVSRFATISLNGKITSGVPFTPMVGSDVNGDGLANDRAFIFDRSKFNDPVASSLDSLIERTSSRSRDCLKSQIGRPAGRNSCDGPWTASMNAAVSITLPVFRRSPLERHEPQLSIYVTNPLGGLDRFLHGSNLKGWGTPSSPDRVLYYVRGFDSTAKRFLYEVNPRFGNTRPTATVFRVPFRVTIDASLSFGPTPAEQQLNRLLRDGRNGNPGASLDSASIVRRYCGSLPDWYAGIIQQADSLLLTRDQLDALREARRQFLARVQAHWGAFAERLAAVPDRYDVKPLLAAQSQTIDAAWDIARDEAQSVLPKILNRIQLRMLPGMSRMLFESKSPIRNLPFFSSGAC